MNTRVAWVLLFTHAVLLVIGGCGVWLAVENFMVVPPKLPFPPKTAAVTPNSSNDQSMEEYDVYSYNRPKAPEDYKKYVRESNYYALYVNDPRFYLAIPCGASLGIAGILFMAGLFSRKIFTTTVGLYSSLGLWILTFLVSIMYQNNPWKQDPLFYASYAWILGFQTGMLILLTLQVGLAMWELRRQKSGWPVINITKVLTLNAILVVTKMTLVIYLAIYWFDSPMMRGFNNSNAPSYRNYWDQPRVRSPIYFTLPCSVVCAYGLIVSAEGLLSHFFGQVHNRLVACNALISAVCYCGFGVVASPIFIRAVFGNYRMYTEVFIFACLMSILNFLHAFASLIFSNALQTPPKFVTTIANSLSSEYFNLQGSDMIGGIRGTILPSFRAVSSMPLTIKFPENIFNSVVSFVALILILVRIDGPTPWSPYVMLCGDVAVFTRNLPRAVGQLFCQKLEPVSVWQNTFSSSIEIIVLFIGSTGIFVSGWPTSCVIAGVINITYVAYQSMCLRKNCCQLIKAAITKTEITQGSEDTQPIVETEPENTQVPSDEDQSIDPRTFA